MDPFTGEIRIFSFDYAPMDWAICNGQMVLVNQYKSLFALIGYQFGGSAPSAFALPNLQSRVPIGVDPGGVGSKIGLEIGSESVPLSVDQMPAHTHRLVGETTAAGVAVATPSANSIPNLVVVGTKAQKAFSTTTTPNVTFNSYTVSRAGQDGWHENRQPFLALNFCICLYGIFPTFP